MVLSRRRPLLLTQIEWDLILFLKSDIKVRKGTSFGHYMCSEYISVDEGRVEFSVRNVHLRRRLSVLLIDLPLRCCQVCFVFLVRFLSV